ncbi:oligosaccharide flippase family protein [Vibrio owensii]|uniref:lipopolysaccharide biosynthesis protein n=1 Tax=Vibrio owensii TaxID=696485 RepID=UPI003392F9AA
MNLIYKLKSFAFGPILGAFLSVITIPLLAWVFDSEDVGRYTLLQTLINFSMLVFSMAMHQAYVRHYNEYEDKSLLLLSSMIPGLAVIVIAFTAYLLFFYGYFSERLFLSSFNFDIMFILILLISYFNYMFMHVIRMKENVIMFNISQVLPKVIILFSVFFLVITKNEVEEHFFYLICSVLLSSLSVFFIYCYVVRQDILGLKLSYLVFSKCKELLKFSLPLFLGSWAYWGLSAMDRFFITWYSDLDNLAIYGVAASFAGVASLLSKILSNTWHPIIYGMKDNEELKIKLYSTCNLVLYFTLVFWCFIGATNWLIGFFLPSDYTDVPSIFLVCISSPLLYMISEITIIGVALKKRTSLAMMSSIVAFISNAVLNFILVPEFGAKGAAIATAISFFLFLMFRTEFSRCLGYEFNSKVIYIYTLLFLFFSIFSLFFEHVFYISFSWVILGLLVFKFKFLPAFVNAKDMNLL